MNNINLSVGKRFFFFDVDSSRKEGEQRDYYLVLERASELLKSQRGYENAS